MSKEIVTALYFGLFAIGLVCFIAGFWVSSGRINSDPRAVGLLTPAIWGCGLFVIFSIAALLVLVFSALDNGGAEA